MYQSRLESLITASFFRVRAPPAPDPGPLGGGGGGGFSVVCIAVAAPFVDERDEVKVMEELELKRGQMMVLRERFILGLAPLRCNMNK